MEREREGEKHSQELHHFPVFFSNLVDLAPFCKDCTRLQDIARYREDVLLASRAVQSPNT